MHEIKCTSLRNYKRNIQQELIGSFPTDMQIHQFVESTQQRLLPATATAKAS